MRIQPRFGFSGSNPPSAIRNPQSRRAFTLIELLVVIAIIVTLAGITLLFLPKQEARLAAKGAEQLQTFIASARSRALRDQAPRGVRLIADSAGNFRSAQLLETPEPIAPVDPLTLPPNPSAGGAGYNQYLGLNPGLTPALQTNPAAALVKQFGYPLQGVVSQGDFLEITAGGTGSIHRIVNVGADSATGTPVSLASAPPLVASSTSPAYQPPNQLPNNYRYIRQPRPLMGEPPLQLPNTVYIMPNAASGAASGSLNIPTSYPDSNNNYYYDIIFSPSGQVINATGGRIVLWLTDDNNVSVPTLLTIYTHTGGVAAHPLAPPGSNPYQYTMDGRSSGQ